VGDGKQISLNEEQQLIISPLFPVRVDESLWNGGPAQVRILAPRAGTGPLLLLHTDIHQVAEETNQIR